MTAQAVLECLPYLPPDVLADVALRAAMLSSGNKVDPATLEYGAICECLRAVGVVSPPISVARRNRRFGQITAGLVASAEYIERHFPVSTRPQRAAVLKMMIELCIRDLRRGGIPVSVFTVGTALRNVGRVIDFAFPGYADAALLWILLRG